MSLVVLAVAQYAHRRAGVRGAESGLTLRAWMHYPAQSTSLAASEAVVPKASRSKQSSKGSTRSDNKKPKRPRLSMTLCPDTPQSMFKYCIFVAVDYPTTHNDIMGRPTLVDFGAVTSIRNLYLKLLTYSVGVGTVRANQRECRK
uniref:Uncharacterized protein n=1 Tax=Cannabis sativa TaxID=3483 RepID=A0A803Q1H7_CANSA